MPLLHVTITRYVDDEPQPGIVECELIDCHSKRHVFLEKTAMPSAEHLTRDTIYPRHGKFQCKIVRRFSDELGKEIVRVNAGLESVGGEIEFDVFASQLAVE